ncbi:hypothetical protein [Glycomyces arizonensis]|uniref:hypothetical protein n=1 Tax=Glycomyces arizonensis TaxID=256035 RepID=UPI00041BB1D7|nr:hypothetical protein [Glycomyces arizonensis]
MNASERTDRWLNRYNVILGIIASLLAIGAFVVTAIASGDDKEEQSGDQAESSSEASETPAVEAPASPSAEPTPTTGGEPASAGGYLDLADAVDTAPCIDGPFYGEWTDDGMQLDGEEYWNGFSCVPYHSEEDELPVGHVDFLVPDGTERVTGTAGFDDRSADTTMTAEFLVHSVPKGDAPLFSQVIAFGEVAEIDVDLTGVQRVQFEVQVRATDYIGSGSLENTATLAWADMKFA